MLDLQSHEARPTSSLERPLFSKASSVPCREISFFRLFSQGRAPQGGSFFRKNVKAHPFFRISTQSALASD